MYIPSFLILSLSAEAQSGSAAAESCIGQLMSEWIVDGAPSLDLHELRLERFTEGASLHEANVI